jgi:hypothetical protein
MSSVLTLVFLLFVQHVVCDYELQGDNAAMGKNPKNSPYKTVPWYWWMASHCGVHAVGVLLVTGSVLLAFLEFVLHFAIDWSKCKGLWLWWLLTGGSL